MGPVNLTGSFTVTDAQMIRANGNSINVVGTLNGDLSLGATSGSWNLLSGSSIVGGTVSTTGGAQLLIPDFNTSTFSNVVLAGEVVMARAALLSIPDQLTLDGLIQMEHTNSTATRVHFTGGDQTLLGTGEVYFATNSSGNQVLPTVGTLTIGPGITIHGQGGTVGSASQGLINQGTIVSDEAGTITVTGTNWSNQNTLDATNGGTISAAGTWSSEGTISVGVGSLFTTTAFTQDSSGTLVLDIGGATQFGRVTVTGGGTANFNGNLVVNIVDGFVPVDESFDVITYLSHVGLFVFDGDLGNGLALCPDYTDPDLTLTVLVSPCSLTAAGAKQVENSQ